MFKQNAMATEQLLKLQRCSFTTIFKINFMQVITYNRISGMKWMTT